MRAEGCTCIGLRMDESCPVCSKWMISASEAFEKHKGGFGKDPECWYCKTGTTAASCTAMPHPMKVCAAHEAHGKELLSIIFKGHLPEGAGGDSNAQFITFEGPR